METMRSLLFFFREQVGLALAAFMLSCFAVFTAQAQQTDQQPVKVLIAAAYSQEITRESTFVGRGEASAKTDLTAQVTGVVEVLAVKDGAIVEAGDLIYLIEPDSYEATVALEQAAVKSAEANLKLAVIELGRKQELRNRETIAESELDIAQANKSVAEAELASARAALQRAELDLERTQIRAPFTGRIGKSSVSLGAVVGPSTGPLATLVQQSPIYVSFSLSEPQLLRILSELETGMAELLARDAAPNVFVKLPDGSILNEPGKIVFLDNRINPSTGTISVRAAFENTRQMILDGSFVSVVIEALEPVTAVLVPQNAVQRDQRGDFVLVVTDQQLVEPRYVTLGAQVETAVIVEEGIRPGESVIVEGLQRVRPGVEVNAVLAGTAAGD